METQKIARLRAWYYAFLITGLIGIINIVTQQIDSLPEATRAEGLIFALFQVLFIALLPEALATIFGMAVMLILGLGLVWLLLAYHLSRKIRFIENPNPKTQRALTVSKVILGILFALLLFVFLFAFFGSLGAA